MSRSVVYQNYKLSTGRQTQYYQFINKKWIKMKNRNVPIFPRFILNLMLYRHTPDPEQKLQGHAGDVYEHSVWTQQHIKLWFQQQNLKNQSHSIRLNRDVLKHLDMTQTLIAAFLHDIGKAGDCIYDVYDPTKDARTTHQIRGAEMLLGKTPFFTFCPSKSQFITPIEWKEIFSQLDPQKQDPKRFTNKYIREVAFAVYMHWEFGRLNIGAADNIVITRKVLKRRVEKYLQVFQKGLRFCNLTRTKRNHSIFNQRLYLLRLCLAVSTADIAGSNRIRLKSLSDPDIPNVVYPNHHDNWKRFKLDVKAGLYQRLLIRTLKQQMTLTSKPNINPI